VTVFRFSDLDLRDPHTFLSLLGCRDFTDTTILGMSANSYFQNDIQNDSDDDGVLETNYLLVFRPLDQTGSGTMEVHVESSCTSPMDGTQCDSSSARITYTTYTTSSSGQCLTALPGTTHPYSSPSITYSGSPCFATGTFDLTINLSGIIMILHDVSISGTFNADPATSVVNGFFRGFMYESDANASLLPSSLALIGGKPLSSILAGGSGCCASTSDMDTYNGKTGWWLYLNFTAPKVTYLGP